MSQLCVLFSGVQIPAGAGEQPVPACLAKPLFLGSDWSLFEHGSPLLVFPMSLNMVSPRLSKEDCPWFLLLKLVSASCGEFRPCPCFSFSPFILLSLFSLSFSPSIFLSFPLPVAFYVAQAGLSSPSLQVVYI